jgi:hypothetical protein
MTKSNICSNVALLRTNVQFERHLFFMNRCSMCIYLVLSRKAVVTNAAFEWFFLLRVKRPAYETKTGELSLCAFMGGLYLCSTINIAF